ncbi:MAG: cell division protein FtsZ [Polynucleobacter sp.]|jgi:cell division protein FtsZ|nr:MAG: cell division protein FtsZ [Polynucleobacter sp.]
MPKVNPEIESFARIKVIGIGGSGKGALNHMINSKLQGVEFIAMNTDTQDLHHSLAEKKIHIGKNLTKGLGAGMDPEIGKRSAEETREEVQDVIKGADMVFIAGGMGGGTGTGAAPVVASIAKNEGILTVGVVTKPFFFEGASRMKLAERGLEELEKEVDALIVIPNDRLLSVIDKNTSVKQAFEMCDEVLKQAVEGISDIIRTAGTINLDFADIKRILKDSGTALMGVGRGMGENRAREAATAAVNSPLLDVSIHGAKGVLFAIYGSEDLGMLEVQEAAKIITESVDKDAKIIFGIASDPTLKKDEVKVTVIATGFPAGFGRSHSSQSSISEKRDAEVVLPEPRLEKRETIKEAIEESKEETTSDDKRIDNSVTVTTEEVESADRRKANKKPVFKFDDDEEEDDDWEALPPFLRRKK